MEITEKTFTDILQSKKLKAGKTYAWVINPKLKEDMNNFWITQGYTGEPNRLYSYQIRYHVLAVGVDLLEVKI